MPHAAEKVLTLTVWPYRHNGLNILGGFFASLGVYQQQGVALPGYDMATCVVTPWLMMLSEY